MSALQSSRLKLARALELFMSLRSANDEFMQRAKIEVACRINAETRRPEYFVTTLPTLPPQIALIAGDVIHNLRSALDHAAVQCYLHAQGATAPLPARVAFPVGDDESHFLNELTRRCQGMNPQAVQAITALRAFKGGNDALWKLHRLDIIDKHLSIPTVLMSYTDMNLTPTFQQLLGPIETPHGTFTPPELPPLFFKVKQGEPVAVGTVLFTDAPDAPITNGLQFKFELAFDVPKIDDRRNMREVIDDLGLASKNAIDAFARCFD
jgi:hypothetical protein